MGGELVAIGGSWGALTALETVLGALPADFGAAIAIALHRAPDVDEEMLPALLDRAGPLPVREAVDKAPLVAGEALVAPPDYHLLVEPGSVALSVDEPVRFSRPSIDVLLESAAESYGPRAIGVVLSGANEDGAAGLAAMRSRGALTAVQDPDEAERPEMPRAALAAAGARALPVAAIGPWLTAAVEGAAAGGPA